MNLSHPQTDHRSWPVPQRACAMYQRWHDLLFAHWPVEAKVLLPFIPASLQLDMFENQAWIGVVPFWMSGIRGRGFPAVPYLSRFPEINVRTYVTDGEKAGVWFLSGCGQYSRGENGAQVLLSALLSCADGMPPA